VRRLTIAARARALAWPAAAAQAHQQPGQQCTPPKDPLAGETFTSDNVEYLGWLPGEAGDMTSGGRLVGRYFYMSGASHFSIYDTLSPESPALVSRTDFGCRFENEDIAVDGKTLIYSDFSLTRAMHVYDVRDPKSPKPIAEIADAGRHTMQCVLDCRYLFGSYKVDNLDAPNAGGSVVDLADPANPKVLGDWTAGDVLPSRKVHDVNEVAPGILASASAPIEILDVRADPLKPKVLGRSPDETKRYHSVEWPRGGKDRWLMAMFETNATTRCEAGVGDFTVFDATGIGTTGEIKPVSSYFLQNGDDDKSQGNPPANAGLGCSPHWFQVRPSWNDGGVLAMASYDHGVKFLRVDAKGAISEVGHFRAPGANAAAAYWITCDIVYVVDYTRGFDVVRFKDEATDCDGASPVPPANAPPPPAAACEGATKPIVRAARPLLRRGRLRLAGRARPSRCGGRIARVEVAFARRGPWLRARGTSRWALSVRTRRGRSRAYVRVTDVFGNRRVVRTAMASSSGRQRGQR
jgi:hypothetical protein